MHFDSALAKRLGERSARFLLAGRHRTGRGHPVVQCGPLLWLRSRHLHERL